MLVLTSKIKIAIFDISKTKPKYLRKSDSFNDIITDYIQLQNQIAIGNQFILIGMNTKYILKICLETL